jgi:hypothetical protein
MKKITLIFSILICSHIIYSQTFFDLGLKGGYGADFLANQNLYDDHNFSPKLSWGHMFGGKIGVDFNESHALMVDVSSSVFNQSYNYSLKNADSTNSSYSRKFSYTALSIALLYKKTSNATYLEVGPQYTMVKKATGSDDFAKTSNVDISDNLVKSYYSLVLGFGGYIFGTDNLGISLGFRATYSLNDLISSVGQQNNFPSINKYTSYKTSNPLTAMMIIGLDYDLGYFATSKCKKRKTRFLLFK